MLAQAERVRGGANSFLPGFFGPLKRTLRGFRETRDRFLFPLGQAAANVIGIQFQNLTDILKRKGPAWVLFEDPLLGLKEQAPAFHASAPHMLLEADNGIFQDGQHQPFFRLQKAFALEGLQIPVRKGRIWLKQRQGSFFWR